MEQGPQIQQTEQKTKDEVRRERILAEIGSFVRTPAIVELAALSGLTFTKEMDTEARLIELRHLAGSNWEFRKGSERPVEDASETLEDKQRKQAIVVADTLKMRDEEAYQDQNPDAGVILGSGGRHALERTRHAIGDTQYIFAGDMEFNTQAITATRKREDTNDTARDKRTEYYDKRLFELANEYKNNITGKPLADLQAKYGNDIPEEERLKFAQIPEVEFMKTAMNAIHGDEQPDGTYKLSEEYQMQEQTVKDTDGEFETKITRYKYTGADDQKTKELVFMEIPARNSGKRVNAEDCYKSLRQILPPTTKKVAISTTQLFAPFQHFDALRLLPGVDNEVTGFSTRTTSFDTPAKYLQETTSAINAAYKLHEQLTQTA